MGVPRFCYTLLPLAVFATLGLQAQNRVALPHHVHPNARPENDTGRVDASLTLKHVTVVLKPSDAQQTDLENFLARQQDPSSPDYRHWLTPEQYATRFGVAQAEIDKLTGWLKSQSLTVDSIARGRNSVAFSGPVRQIENAFQIEIHNFNVRGETHFANTSDPMIPTAFAGMVNAIHGLHDFRLRAHSHIVPHYTSPTSGSHYLAPDDVASLYDVKPLYGTGVTGAGQKIAIVGQTQIAVSDIQQFRSYFNLPPSDPQITLVPNTQDPGTSKSDLGEADLDIEWSGAVARNATILYIYSADVTDAVHYAIDQNLAPVISMSYGLCEPDTGGSDLASLRTFAQQANAQGITWLAASGDSGGGDCFASTSRTAAGISVDTPASVPEVTGVGGSTLNDAGGSYWNASNDPNHSSVLSYVPETAWNDSVNDGSPSAGGGGASTTFLKPAWQTGTGVPADGARDVPDIALSASADHDAYLMYSSGSLQGVGGTSVGAPVFAGMAALLNQYLVANGLQTTAGLGNINPRLYSLAQTVPGAFHDITSGSNIVDTCTGRARNCTSTQVGFNAGPGYDQATGLGSVDAYNLITGWHQTGSAVKASANLQLVSSLQTIPQAGSAVLTATITAANGGIPTGTVTFFSMGAAIGSAPLVHNVATLPVSASQLTAGDALVSAQYSGDAVYSPAAATITVTVASSGTLSLQGLTSAASFKKVYAPGMIMAIFGSQMSGSTLSAAAVPLPTQLGGVTATINGIPAPFYFVSPGQLNVQIPNEIPVSSTGVLKVTYNGQSATSAFTVASAAPGIFADASGAAVPDQTALRGQTITLFVTGTGAASPAAATGALPAAGTTPKPVQSTTVTVAGLPAATTYVGTPAWAIGLTQINYTVPMNAPLGAQQAIVTVGGVASAPVTLTIQ